MDKVTYHGKKGRFCGKDNAKIVTKGGEQFRVIRQHRRVKPKSRMPTKKRSGAKAVKETLARMAIARDRVRLTDHLDQDFVSMKGLFDG